MLAWIDRAAVVLFDSAVSTSLFLTFIVLIMLCCRQPARRILIARVAIFASLAMIPLVALVPLPRLDLVEAVVQPPWSPVHWLLESPPLNGDGAAGGSSRTSVAGSLLGDPFFLLSHTHGGAWWMRAMAILAFLGMAIGIAWLALGFWGVRWLFKHSRQPSISTLGIYHGLRPSAGQVFPAELRVSNQIHHPSIFGVLRPVIFIPARYEEGGGSSSEAIRLSLLHEMAHADRADSWFGAAASLAQSIWFFVPQIWWVRGQLMIDQEFLADRTAALAYGTSTHYASSLITLAGGSTQTSGVPSRLDTRPSTLAAPTRAGAPSELFQRVLMLLHCPYLLESDVSRGWTWLVRSALISASVLAACLCIRWPDPSHDFSQSDMAHHSSHHTFQVAHIIARPQPAPGGRGSLPFPLPLALPASFEITVKLRSSPADLTQIRIAGVPLAVKQAGALPSHEIVDSSDFWHHVRLVQTETVTHLTVDGRDVPVAAAPSKSLQWLTIEPAPDYAAELRDLKVVW